MSRGFVTLAVGNEKYYMLALNLLISYKFHTKKAFPFAIICDRENNYTKHFDKVIVIENANRSYLDKITMLSIAPFNENIFIDADSLAYKDLNEYWEYMPKRGVSCFGASLALDSHDGWFEADNIGEYKDKINFIPQMHGGIIFFRKDSLTEAIYNECLKINSNYEKYKFKYFSSPADEPILALSMAVFNCHPISSNGKMYLFYPIAKKIVSDISRGELKYSLNNSEWFSDIILLHWQNLNTNYARYKIEVDKLTIKNSVLRCVNRGGYHIDDVCLKKVSYYCKRVREKLFGH